MGYKGFESIINDYISESPETMEFLRQQALEILQECETEWQNSCPSEDLNDIESRWDYYQEANKRFEKYFAKWIFDLKDQFCFSSALPSAISYMFESIIEKVIMSINLEDTQNIMNQIIEDDYQTRKESL
jgi:hypothetical protein